MNQAKMPPEPARNDSPLWLKNCAGVAGIAVRSTFSLAFHPDEMALLFGLGVLSTLDI
jgi:hypothetical protein